MWRQAPRLTVPGKDGRLDVKQQTAHSCLNLQGGIDHSHAWHASTAFCVRRARSADACPRCPQADQVPRTRFFEGHSDGRGEHESRLSQADMDSETRGAETLIRKIPVDRCGRWCFRHAVITTAWLPCCDSIAQSTHGSIRELRRQLETGTWPDLPLFFIYLMARSASFRPACAPSAKRESPASRISSSRTACWYVRVEEGVPCLDKRRSRRYASNASGRASAEASCGVA